MAPSCPRTFTRVGGKADADTMPNGGPDNCSNCRFNRDPERPIGYCALRQVTIANTHWTYCRDFTSVHSADPLLAKAPTGPIFASGGYEAGVGYVRIP